MSLKNKMDYNFKEMKNFDLKEIIIIGITTIVLLLMVFNFLNINKKNQDIELKIKNIAVPEKKDFIKQVVPSEVERINKKVNEQYVYFLQGNFTKKYNVGDKGYDFLKNTFNLPSDNISKKTSKKERFEKLKGFKYEISDFAIKNTDNGYQAIYKTFIEWSKNGRTQYVVVDLDRNYNIKGGEFLDEVN